MVLIPVPVSLTQETLSSIEETCNYKHKSDMCYEPERKIVAIGLSNGYIYFVNRFPLAVEHFLTRFIVTEMCAYAMLNRTNYCTY